MTDLPRTAERLAQSAPANVDNVIPLRNLVVGLAARAGADDMLQASVKLAVCEALNNVAIHAYAEHPAPGPMEVEAWIDGAALIVVVLDEGVGLAPRPDSPGLGLGLPLLAELADDFRVETRTDRAGTRVAMRFSLDGSGSAFSRRD